MIVKIHELCNNNCHFCDRCIKNNKKSDEFVICGGEPTISNKKPIKDIISAIIKESPEAKLILHTNGRIFSYDYFVKEIAYSGLNNLQIILYSSEAKDHDKITRTKKSFQQTIKGIDKLSKYPLNIKIELRKNEHNKNAFHKTISWAKKKFTGMDIIINDMTQDKKIKEEDSDKKIPDNLFNIIKRNIQIEYMLNVDSIAPVKNYLQRRNLDFIIKINKKKYFFKIFIRKGLNLIEDTHATLYNRRVIYETNILKFLQNTSVDAVCPVETKTGKQHINIGRFTGVLYPFIEGNEYEHTNEELISAAKMLAEYHKQMSLSKIDAKKKFREIIPIEISKLNTFLSDEYLLKKEILNKDDIDLLKKIMKKIEYILEEKIYSKLTKTHIHGDVYPGNLIFTKEKTYIFDFENVNFGPVIYDIVNAMFEFSLENGKINREKKELFLYSYTDKFKLKNEDMNCMKIMLQYYLITCIGTRIKKIHGKGLEKKEFDKIKYEIKNFKEEIKKY